MMRQILVSMSLCALLVWPIGCVTNPQPTPTVETANDVRMLGTLSTEVDGYLNASIGVFNSKTTPKTFRVAVSWVDESKRIIFTTNDGTVYTILGKETFFVRLVCPVQGAVDLYVKLEF